MLPSAYLLAGKMPAKKRNDPKFKPFIGRIFTLRQHQKIPTFKDNKERIDITLENFGNVALVLDENNTRVKITLNNGTFTWIPKFYLHKEIKNGVFEEVDVISKCLQNLLLIAEDMRTKEFDESYVFYVEEIEKIANLLRYYIDDKNPSSKNKD